MIHIWRPRKLFKFQDPPPSLSIYVQNSSTPRLDLGRPISNRPCSLNHNQSIKRKIQEWLFYVIRPFFQIGSLFQYKLINLVWLSFYFFSFSWSLTISLKNVNKLWNNNRTVYVNEQNQNKKKTKSSHIQIDHALYCSI